MAIQCVNRYKEYFINNLWRFHKGGKVFYAPLYRERLWNKVTIDKIADIVPLEKLDDRSKDSNNG